MPHPTGPVAERFASRIAAIEERIAVAAGGALLRDARAAAARRRGLLAAHAVPARPRPDRPLQVVSPPEAEDPGVHRAAGRPLPHPADAHAGGVGHRPRRGPRAAAERGPGRGGRARPRPRPRAVRPHRRGGARPGARARLRPPLPPQPALAADRRRARARRPRPEPDPGGARRDPEPHRRQPSRPRSRAGSCGWSTASPTSTTTSTTRCGPASWTSAQLPDGAGRAARATPRRSGSTRWCTTWSSTRRSAGEVRQSPPIAEALLELRAFMFEHVYLGPIARRETVRAGRDGRGAARALHRCRRRAAGRPTTTTVTRATDWVAGMTDRYCMRAYDELLAPR